MVQVERTESPFSSFLPIQHDGRRAATEKGRLLGRSDLQDRLRPSFAAAQSVHGKQPVCPRPQAGTGQRSSQLPRQSTGRLQNGSGGLTAQEFFILFSSVRSQPRRRESCVSGCVGVTQRRCGWPTVQREGENETWRSRRHKDCLW